MERACTNLGKAEKETETAFNPDYRKAYGVLLTINQIIGIRGAYIILALICLSGTVLILPVKNGFVKRYEEKLAVENLRSGLRKTEYIFENENLVYHRRGDCVAAVDVRMDRMQDYTERFGERVWVQRVDVTDGAGVRKTFAVAVRYFDAIDVCVNNAGLMYLGAVEELTGDEMRQIMDVNYIG